MSKQDIEKLESSTRSQFEKFIKNCSLNYLQTLKKYWDDVYYNTGDSKLDDQFYDILKDFIIEKIGESNINVGCKLRDDEKEVKLEYYLGSMDKVKLSDQDVFNRWIKNNSTINPSNKYLVMSKLDGISCLLHHKNDKISLYTRADGVTGKDVSYIKDFINCIPKNISTELFVRGELVMSKNNFSKLNSTQFVNARNTVAGAVKAKTLKKTLYSVDFVAYELIDKDIVQIEISNQLNYLDKLGFRTVKRESFDTKPDLNLLCKTLEKFKDKEHYDIDGLIIQKDDTYLRNTDKNPKYAIAFKNDTEFAETEVLDVVWSASRHGILKPVVHIKPCVISGATISKATGYNAWFIKENNIGEGAIVNITRSGDVIPKILDVVKPSSKPKFPNTNWHWNETKIDIIQDFNDNNSDVKIKRINYWLKTMKVKNFNEATCKKLVEAGHDTIPKILDLKIEDFKNLPGFADISSKKAYNTLHKSLENIDDYCKILVSSGCFGFGIGVNRIKLVYSSYDHDEFIKICKYFNKSKNKFSVNSILNEIDTEKDLNEKDFKLVLQKFGKSLDEDDEDNEIIKISQNVSQKCKKIYDKIIDIQGFSHKMAIKMVVGIMKFDKFYKNIEKHISFENSSQKTENSSQKTKTENKILLNKKIVISGFRSEDLSKAIENIGGTISSTVSKNTFCIIVKDKTSTSQKIEKAKNLNIDIFNLDEFVQRFEIKL